MKIEWINLKPFEFYYKVIDNKLEGERISTHIKNNIYKSYYRIDGQLIILYYKGNQSKIFPDHLSKEELTKYFKIILRRDKLNKLMKKI